MGCGFSTPNTKLSVSHKQELTSYRKPEPSFRTRSTTVFANVPEHTHEGPHTADEESPVSTKELTVSESPNYLKVPYSDVENMFSLTGSLSHNSQINTFDSLSAFEPDQNGVSTTFKRPKSTQSFGSKSTSTTKRRWATAEPESEGRRRGKEPRSIEPQSRSTAEMGQDEGPRSGQRARRREVGERHKKSWREVQITHVKSNDGREESTGLHSRQQILLPSSASMPDAKPSDKRRGLQRRRERNGSWSHRPAPYFADNLPQEFPARSMEHKAVMGQWSIENGDHEGPSAADELLDTLPEKHEHGAPQDAGHQAVNPFAELVDTTASYFDQLLTTTSLNPPSLTTVIGNPLASNGSMDEAERQQLDALVESSEQPQGDGFGVSLNGVQDWPGQLDPCHPSHSTSAQMWQPLAPFPRPLSSAPLNFPAGQSSPASISFKSWNKVSSDSNTDEAPRQLEASEGKLGGIDAGQEALHGLESVYENLGPICDLSLHSISLGAMRLLLRKVDGCLFAGKFISRPEGGGLHKWHEREIMNHRKVHGHPNIIGFVDLILSGLHAVIIMEYAAGGSLAALLQGHRRLEEPAARVLFKQLAAGLVHCHSLGVSHRNLQPECILLSGDEAHPVLKIGGFSRSKSEEADSQPKSAVSSPGYTAPELLMGSFHDPNEPQDQLLCHSANPLDVWAAAILLYQMLFGFNPFQGSRLQDSFSTQMIRRICSADFSFPEAPQVSEGCRDLIRRCLVVDPGARISAAGILQHPWLSSPQASRRTTVQQAGKEGVPAGESGGDTRAEESIKALVARARRRRGKPIGRPLRIVQDNLEDP